MSNNIKKTIKKKIDILLETKGFEDMEVAFGVKHKSDNLSKKEKAQFGSLETIQDKETGLVKLGSADVQPQLDKVHKEEMKDAEEYYKMVLDRMRNFQKTDTSEPSQIGEAFEIKKVNREDDQTKEDEVYSTEALGPGMLALKYDNEGTPVYDKFMKRMDELNDDDSTYKKLRAYSEKYLKHKYKAPDEYHYTPKVRTTDKPINEGMFGDDFGDVPNHRELIDGWLKDGNKKAINDYISNLNGPEKEDAQNYLKGRTSNSSDLRENYSDVIKENIFKTKSVIKSKEQVLKLTEKLPNRIKVNETEFAITDGENYYKLIWEGSINGEAVITHEKNTKLVNETIDKMKHLWNFNSSKTISTKGIVKETEDDKFKKTFRKLKENSDWDSLTDEQKIERLMYNQGLSYYDAVMKVRGEGIDETFEEGYKGNQE